MPTRKRRAQPSSSVHDGWSACVAQAAASSFQNEPNLSSTKRSRHEPHPSASTPSESDTIFIPNVSHDLRSHHALAALFPQPISSVRFATSKQRTIAWVSLPSVPLARDALAHLSKRYPSLAARPHVPKCQNANPQHCPSPNTASLESRFDKRLHAVCANGGIGNTLVFMNLPLQVTIPEFTKILTTPNNIHNHNRNNIHNHNPDLALALATPEPPPTPIGVRTALSRSGSSRSFWAVFSNVHQARLAFVATFGNKVSLRCGSIVTLRPGVHDDSTDADETRRRQRALLLQPDRRNFSSSHQLTPHPQSACRALEAFLTNSQTSFAFLTHCHTSQRSTNRATLNVASAPSPPLQLLP